MAKFISSFKQTSIGRRFISGASWVFVGKLISAAATLACNALLARLLSPEEMGFYFLVFSLVSFFAIWGQWGLNRGLVKLVAAEIAVDRSDLARSGILTAFIIVSLISSLIVLFFISPLGEWLVVKISGSDVLVPLVWLLALWIMIKAFQGIVSESFRGFHDIRLATIFGGLTTAVVSLALYTYVWVVQGQATLSQVLQLVIVAAGFSLLLGLFILIRKLDKCDRGEKKPISKIAKFGFPLFVTSVVIFGVREVHIWVLAMYQPEQEVALYGAALHLVTLLAMPLIIVNSVLPPIVAELYSQKEMKKLESVLQKTATLIGALALAILVFLFVFGESILSVVYGESYRLAFIPLLLLCIGQFVNALTGSPGILLTMSGHEHVVMRSAVIAGIVGVLCTIVTVQELGGVGAALGFAVGLVLVNVFMWAYCYRKLDIATHGSLWVLLNLLREFRARI